MRRVLGTRDGTERLHRYWRKRRRSVTTVDVRQRLDLTGARARRARWGDWTLFGLSGGATLLTLVTFGLIVWKIVDQARPSVGQFGFGFLDREYLERRQRRVRCARLHLRDGDHVPLRAVDRDADRDRDRLVPVRSGPEAAAVTGRCDGRDAGRRAERPDRPVGNHRPRPGRAGRHRARTGGGARLDAVLLRAGVRLHGREHALGRDRPRDHDRPDRLERLARALYSRPERHPGRLARAWGHPVGDDPQGRHPVRRPGPSCRRPCSGSAGPSARRSPSRR